MVPLLDKILGELSNAAAPEATIHDLPAREAGRR
jgi:hypothetical protein